MHQFFFSLVSGLHEITAEKFIAVLLTAGYQPADLSNQGNFLPRIMIKLKSKSERRGLLHS
jgi:hypothetical protein